MALTVSGYFATILLENGYEDAELLTALTFALVLSTVVLHGFSIGSLAKKLNLTTTDESGVLIVGGIRFAAEFAQSVKETGNDVLLSISHGQNYHLPESLDCIVYVGDILSEQIDYHFDLSPYRYMLAMTKTDMYNAHVCSDFTPDLGSKNLYQTEFNIGNEADGFTITGGQSLFSPAISIYDLEERMNVGHGIRKTLITKQYSYTQYLRERDDKSILLYILRADGAIEFFTPKTEPQAIAGDAIIALTSPEKTIERVKERLDEENSETAISYEKVEDLFIRNEKLEKPVIPGDAPLSSK